MRTLLILVTLVILGISPAAAETVIAHPECGVEGLAGSDLKKMFLGKKKTWANGTKVSLAVPKKSAAFDAFLKKYRIAGIVPPPLRGAPALAKVCLMGPLRPHGPARGRRAPWDPSALAGPART